MVKSCSAFGCTNRFEKGSGITFHSFPSQPELRKQWEKALGRKNWKAGKSSCICSVHFKEDWFDRTGQTVRLRRDAIPSVFDDLDLQNNTQEKLMEYTAYNPMAAINRKVKRRCPIVKDLKDETKQLKEEVKDSILIRVAEIRREKYSQKRKAKSLAEVIDELKRKQAARQQSAA